MDFRKKGVEPELFSGVIYLALFIVVEILSLLLNIFLFKKELLIFVILFVVLMEFLSRKINVNYDKTDNYNKFFYFIFFIELIIVLLLAAQIHNVYF